MTSGPPILYRGALTCADSWMLAGGGRHQYLGGAGALFHADGLGCGKQAGLSGISWGVSGCGEIAGRQPVEEEGRCGISAEMS